MAIPFYEPKTTTTPPNQQQQNLNNSNSSANLIYDQVDGLIGFTIPPSQQQQQPTTNASSSSSSTMPPPSTPVGGTTAAATLSSSIFGFDFNIPTTISQQQQQQPTVSSYEQQALAWKILAITMCKALKEYHQQTSSSKDAFTNQTVQVLPDGQVQPPTWK